MSSQQAGAFIGIDLGTTNSLIAVVRGKEPVILPNSLGDSLTPSAVSLRDGEILVGDAALASAVTRPEATFLAFKRDMGTDTVYPAGDRTLTPQELSAVVLKTLRHDAEAALGGPVAEAVVSVPAYFDDLQRQATREAASIAGLPVERLINEPTAAALAYGLHQRQRELRAVVLDLGGGTFDITVLEILEGVIEIQSSAGDTRLGGEDFKLALAQWAAEEARRKNGIDVTAESTAWARMLAACERAKRTLTRSERASIALPQLSLEGQLVDLEVTIARDQADELWQPLLSRLLRPMQRALLDAGLKAEQIDEVLLVGGATRMPCIARAAAQFFGSMPLRTLPPDEAVALGAALQAGLKAGDAALHDLVVTDVAPFSLGIAVCSPIAGRLMSDVYSIVLERGTVIPTSRVETYSTVAHNQTEILVRVYQGEHSLVRDNRKLGELRIKGIPPAPAGAEPVHVRFTYDLNGIVEVEVQIESTGQTQSLLIEGSPGRFTPQELELAQKAMKSLKFHPRDALPNTAALERAEALYVELTGLARQELGEALLAFRSTLESQNSELIEDTRTYLLQLMSRLDSQR